KQGLAFQFDTKVTGASVQGGQVIVNAQSHGTDSLFQGDKVLVAVGRQPCTTGLGLDDAGIKRDELTGRVIVEDGVQTSVACIYAIGDLIAGPMLAHKAQEEGSALAERLAGMKTEVNYDAIPSVVYTWPELASVGRTEEQLKEEGREYKVGKFPFAANGRGRCLDGTEAIVQLLADAHTDPL